MDLKELSKALPELTLQELKQLEGVSLERDFFLI